ncbi:hypothetical protein HK096_010169, partial [Nowakowskiella sp. JEL0078]
MSTLLVSLNQDPNTESDDTKNIREHVCLGDEISLHDSGFGFLLANSLGNNILTVQNQSSNLTCNAAVTDKIVFRILPQLSFNQIKKIRTP